MGAITEDVKFKNWLLYHHEQPAGIHDHVRKMYDELQAAKTLATNLKMALEQIEAWRPVWSAECQTFVDEIRQIASKALTNAKGRNHGQLSNP